MRDLLVEKLRLTFTDESMAEIAQQIAGGICDMAYHEGYLKGLSERESRAAPAHRPEA